MPNILHDFKIVGVVGGLLMSSSMDDQSLAFMHAYVEEAIYYVIIYKSETFDLAKEKYFLLMAT
jgi:hypothetical protein